MKRERFTAEDVMRVGEPSSGDLGTGDGKARARGSDEPGSDEFKTTEERRMAPDMLRSTTNLVKGLGSGQIHCALLQGNHWSRKLSP